MEVESDNKAQEDTKLLYCNHQYEINMKPSVGMT